MAVRTLLIRKGGGRIIIFFCKEYGLSVPINIAATRLRFRTTGLVVTLKSRGAAGEDWLTFLPLSFHIFSVSCAVVAGGGGQS